jgi:hypothetical protein
MRRVLLGPVVADLSLVGLDSKYLTIASAFYSRQRLDALAIDAVHLDLLVRLDTSDLTEWISGAVDPDALRQFGDRLIQNGVQVRLFVSPTAHAKVYLGASGFLVGSANLTVRGFGGLANEILWYESDLGATRAMKSALGMYRAGLRLLELQELADFVTKNRDGVKKARAKLRSTQRSILPAEDLLPRSVARPARLGDFCDFVRWLDGHRGAAHRLIARRARGEGQLSGHIRRNFFGLRQFFIAHPTEMQDALRQDPRNYALHQDPSMQDALRSFVLREAVDEDAFSVGTWRTYLPQSAGGKPKTGGGTSGNLKRMIPLVARYLKTKVG